MTLPDLPDAFHWTSEPWGTVLRCRPLEPAARHLFSTRQLELPSGSGWAQLASAMEVRPSHVWSVNQVHGNAVVVASGDAPAERPAADALIAVDGDVALVIRAADCVPLLMADTGSGAVAAVHAGWRGTAARIGVAALAAMQQAFGTRPQDVIAAIGPAIGSCCYEVGSELVDAFAAAGHERYLIDRWFASPPPRRGERRDPAAKLRLDVPGSNRDQLILAGVPESQIHLAGLCTAMHLDVLTSYRAEKEKATRLAGVIRPLRS